MIDVARSASDLLKSFAVTSDSDDAVLFARGEVSWAGALSLGINARREGFVLELVILNLLFIPFC